MDVSKGCHPGPTAYYVKYRPVFEAAPPGARISPNFAGQRLACALGANPWGTSLVVGAGTTFPHCMQSQIANLAGPLSGTGDIQVGATVGGPSSPDNFSGLGTVSGMRTCSRLLHGELAARVRARRAGPHLGQRRSLR
jgi:hypothetical protein